MTSRPGSFLHCFCDGVEDTDDDGGEMLADFCLLCVCVRACVVLSCIDLCVARLHADMFTTR